MQKANFNNSKEKIWSHLAEQINTNLDKDKFQIHDVLRYSYGEWEITLDQYYVHTGTQKAAYTRMRAPFVNKDGLQFEIYNESLTSSIAKLFGMQDILVGDTFFDDNFIIKGNNEEKIKILLNDKKLMELIELLPDLSFQIREDDGWFSEKFPEGVNELYFLCEGKIKDEAMLKTLFEVFSITLERLVEIDSAYEGNPHIKL